jgi:hypothetical protein
MEHWIEMTKLARDMRDDHLLVIITARQGTLSYKATFDRLPDELTKYFDGHSFIIVYPDQNGQPQDSMTFTAPQRQTELSAYDALCGWLFRKSHKQ